MVLQILFWEVSCTDLLRDTTGFTCLHLRPPQLIKDQRLSRIDVTHDADDWATKLFVLVLSCCQLFLLLLL